MALNFFRQRDIERMDINDIPEEFINYFETLDDGGKAALVGSRPDLAKALGFVLPEIESVEGSDVSEAESAPVDAEIGTTDLAEEGVSPDDTDEDADDTDGLIQIHQNFYEGKDLDHVLKGNMPELEALAIPDGASICMLHRTHLDKKQIYYRDPSTKSTYGIVLRVCRECHRVYLEESKMLPIHEALVERGIPHTFYDLDLTTQYLRSQMPPHEFTADDVLQIPDTWIEEAPRCPVHEELLYEVPCLKKYKDRVIHFTGYRCDRCGKYLMRWASALDLQDRCAEAGLPGKSIPIM